MFHPMNFREYANDSGFFILGVPRSGTTLLSVILDAHPDIAVPPETHFFPTNRSKLRLSAGVSKGGIEAQVHRLLALPRFNEMKLSEASIDAIIDFLDHLPAPGEEDMFLAAINAYRVEHDKSRWGEKTAPHIFHALHLGRAFPRAQFIHIVRDPRDVSLSWQRAWSDYSSFVPLAQWMRASKTMSDFGHRWPERLFEVKYEHLIEEPERIVAHVCEYLNVAYHGDLLSYAEGAINNFDIANEPWKAKSLEPVDAHNKDKWKSQMSSSEVWLAETWLRRGMERYGYEFAGANVTAHGSLNLAWHLFVDCHYHMRRIMRRTRNSLYDPGTAPDPVVE